MPRGKAATSDGEERKNTYNPADLEKAVEEIEEELAYIEELNAQNATKVAVVKQRIGAAYKRYKALGIAKKPLKAIIEDRKHQRKREDRIKSMEEDEQETFFDYQKALGIFADTPLGKAALERKELRDKAKSSAVDSFVPSPPTPGDPVKNAELLGNIKELKH